MAIGGGEGVRSGRTGPATVSRHAGCDAPLWVVAEILPLIYKDGEDDLDSRFAFTAGLQLCLSPARLQLVCPAAKTALPTRTLDVHDGSVAEAR